MAVGQMWGKLSRVAFRRSAWVADSVREASARYRSSSQRPTIRLCRFVVKSGRTGNQLRGGCAGRDWISDA